MSQYIPEIIEDGSRQDEPEGFVATMLQTIANTIFESSKEVVTILRQQTPIKVSHVFVVDTHGNIGNGIANPDPDVIYECPMSAEATIHRITVWCPEHPPSTPLNTGEIVCYGSTAQEIIFYLPMEPDQTQVAPMQPVIEGSQSAPHLNAGERMLIVGDNLPAGIHIRVDIQVLLNIGSSQYTPRQSAPTNLDNSPYTHVK